MRGGGMRVDAFLNNMFGGIKDAFGAGTVVEDEEEDLVAQEAVEERIRVEVTLGGAVQVEPAKRVVKAPGPQRLNHNTMNRLQLSNATCAATARTARGVGAGAARQREGCCRDGVGGRAFQILRRTSSTISTHLSPGFLR
jgi:hypothetical protein